MSYWKRVEVDELGVWDVPSAAGVYVIATDRGMYVGSSRDMVRYRFRPEHFLWMKRVKVYWVKVKLSRKLGDWRMEEYRLIHRLKPALNTSETGRAKRSSLKAQLMLKPGQVVPDRHKLMIKQGDRWIEDDGSMAKLLEERLKKKV